MKALIGFAGLGLAVCLVACDSQDPVPDGGVDAGDAGTIEDGGNAQPTDAGTDAGSSPTTCSGFVTDAGEIAQMFVATATPVGAGGTIVDGVYDLTAWSVYTGASGGTGATGTMVSATQVIQAGVYQYNHRWREADAGGELDTNGTFTALDGGALVAQQKCPPGPQPFTSYSTDGTNLVFYSSNPPWGLAFKRR